MSLMLCPTAMDGLCERRSVDVELVESLFVRRLMGVYPLHR